MTSLRKIWTPVLLGTVFTNVGCADLLWNLQPYRLHRMNRCAPPSLDPEFTSLDRNEQMKSARTALDASPVFAVEAIVRGQSDK